VIAGGPSRCAVFLAVLSGAAQPGGKPAVTG
jgi:hypothetical protein